MLIREDRYMSEEMIKDSDKVEEFSIEETFEKLDSIIATLEDEDTSLEDSIKAYEQGMQFVKKANEAIDTAEKKVLVIRENGELDEF